MIDFRNKAESKEVLERFISDCEEITGFYNKVDKISIEACEREQKKELKNE